MSTWQCVLEWGGWEMTSQKYYIYYYDCSNNKQYPNEYIQFGNEACSLGTRLMLRITRQLSDKFQ